MVKLDTEICVCNSINVGELAECIKKNNLSTLDEVLENTDCPIGDKCESCQDEGFNNDGFNISMVLAMVERNTVPKN
ncbi:MAG: bacterioferritin-associated ferredoxin [Sulfurimonas sp.]|jgi:bacterioferritin-associated ferredoxin|uniref:(2Fe-2S)-binding protein n=1 Tax=Sulfurimonas sp. TaxID=2022749 RepID=UPI0039E22E5F